MASDVGFEIELMEAVDAQEKDVIRLTARCISALCEHDTRVAARRDQCDNSSQQARTCTRHEVSLRRAALRPAVTDASRDVFEKQKQAAALIVAQAKPSQCADDDSVAN